MITSIGRCMSSLFWAVLLLLCFVYLFTVFLMEAVRAHLPFDDEVVNDAFMEFHDGVSATMFWLCVGIFGGKDWFDIVKPFVELHQYFGLIFLLFIGFVTLGMLNVLTVFF